jgi:hypothetical protein
MLSLRPSNNYIWLKIAQLERSTVLPLDKLPALYITSMRAKRRASRNGPIG